MNRGKVGSVLTQNETRDIFEVQRSPSPHPVSFLGLPGKAIQSPRSVWDKLIRLTPCTKGRGEKKNSFGSVDAAPRLAG